ncbi:MAG: DUF2288 domain-containing protein [Verrucomicrobiae bacterium]|nr:DUF2288 domain-containing protein [Verrucomicrobiae bacterium]
MKNLPHDSDPSDEPMRYGMLGEDTSTTGEKLEKYTGEVGWIYLRSHFEAGALLYVDPSLKLTEVGQAFADDDADRVAEWRQGGDLVSPSQPHADYWEESGATFRALVVSPFVLIQPIES